MGKIQSVTLSYVSTEDRIQLATLLDDGKAVSLWLTQRLARTLVGALANHMEQVEAIPLPSVRQAVMAQEQAEAVAAVRPAPPVKIEAATSGHLIRDITLSLSPDHIGLAFASDLDVKPSIVLDRTLSHQWLSILHRQFVQAGWPQDVWPGWMIENDLGAVAGATRH